MVIANFNSIAAHCDFSHVELRSAVAQFLTEHFDDYASYFAEGESVSSYIEQLSINGTWGDNLSLLICAELLHAPIKIAQSHGVQVISPSQCTNPPYLGLLITVPVIMMLFMLWRQPPFLHHPNGQAEILPSHSSSPRREEPFLKNPQSWTVMTAMSLVFMHSRTYYCLFHLM